MKASIFAIGAIILLSSTPSFAQVDSVGMTDTIISSNVNFASSALGLPDNRQATIITQGELALAFSHNGHFFSFQRGAKIHLYWNRESGDSAGARVQFMRYTDNLIQQAAGPIVIVGESGVPGQSHMTTITVPDTNSYNALDFTLADSITPGGIPITGFGAKVFYLDAAVLIQPVNAVASQEPLPPTFTSFPNPFVHGSNVTFEVTTDRSGTAEVLIEDMLGRLVERVAIGQVDIGRQSIMLPFHHQGVYVARLHIDGLPSGPAIKLSAE